MVVAAEASLVFPVKSEISVVVVEELTAIRELVGEFVGKLEGFRVVGMAGTPAEAERECGALRPDVALIDWVPIANGPHASLAEGIRKSSPATKIVMFAAEAEPHFVGEAIAAGVSGFVVKNTSLKTLEKALRAVAGGKQFFCAEMAGVLRELLQQSSATSAGRSDLLTPREREVLREIAKGHFSKEIAHKFDLTVFAVENIRRRIMRKTGLKSVAELTLHAVRLRLVSLPALPPLKTAGPQRLE